MISFHVQTDEYRWPVINLGEPEGVRIAKGYVALIEQQAAGMPFATFRVMFLDTEGRPFQSMPLDLLDIFHDAAHAACVELNIDLPEGYDWQPSVGGIIR